MQSYKLFLFCKYFASYFIHNVVIFQQINHFYSIA